MAPFSEDGRWCRARVKGGPRTLTDGDGVLLVEYVDFGSCYEHRPSELRAIPVELLEFPVQTVQDRAASRDDAQRGGGVTSMLKRGGFFCFEGRRNSRRPLASHAGVQ
ncbi:unnamed protein product [Lampetra planeri]